MDPEQSFLGQWAGLEPSGTRLLYSNRKEPMFGFQLHQDPGIMNLNIDKVLNMNQYKCHICNVEVPKTYTIEHINGEKHKTYKKIAETALDRMRQQMNLEPLISHTKVEFSDTFFCETCVLVVLNSQKNDHESSVKHKIAVKHDELLSKFAHVYVNNGTFELDENAVPVLDLKFEELLKRFVNEQSYETGKDMASVGENNKDISALNDTSAMIDNSAIKDTSAINTLNNKTKNKIVGKVTNKPKKANKPKKTAIENKNEQNFNDTKINGIDNTKENTAKNVNHSVTSNLANGSGTNGINITDSATHSNDNLKDSQINDKIIINTNDSSTNNNTKINDSVKSVIKVVDDSDTSCSKNVNDCSISGEKTMNGTSCTENVNDNGTTCINNVKDIGENCTKNVNDSASSGTKNTNYSDTSCTKNVNDNDTSCTKSVKVCDTNVTSCINNVNDIDASGTKNINESDTVCFKIVNDSGKSCFRNVNDLSTSSCKTVHFCSTSGKNMNINATDVKTPINDAFIKGKNLNNNKYKETMSKKNNKKMKKPVDLFTSVQDVRNYLINLKERCDIKGAPKVRAASNQMVNITTLNGDKLRVSLEHFHGACKLGTFCRVCQLDNIIVEKHILEDIHMDRIMMPLDDKHCIRKISDVWSHCVLCNHTFATRDIILHVLRAKHKDIVSMCVLETNNNNINKNLSNNSNQLFGTDINLETVEDLSQTDKNYDKHICETENSQPDKVAKRVTNVTEKDVTVAGKSQPDKVGKTVTNVSEKDVTVAGKSQMDNSDVSSPKSVKTDNENAQIGAKNSLTDKILIVNSPIDKDSSGNLQRDKNCDTTDAQLVCLDISEIKSIRLISNPKTENTHANVVVNSLADKNVDAPNQTNKEEIEHSNPKNRYSDAAKLILQNHLQSRKNHYYCLFCDEMLPKVALYTHIAKPEHNVYYKKFIKQNNINEIDGDTYYCIPCDICVAVGHLIKHCQSKKHVKMLMTQQFDMESIEPKAVVTESKKIDVKMYDAKAVPILNPQTKQELICEECNSVIENGDFTAHLYTMEHITNHINYINYNKITEINTDTVNCNACVKTFEIRYLVLHCNSQLHINNIGQIQCVGESSLTLTKNEGVYVDVSSQTDPEPTTKTPVIPNPAQPSISRMNNAPIPKKLIYQFLKARKIDGLTCNVCREGLTIPFSKIDVINHVNTEKHKNNYNNLMKLNRISCSPCKKAYYCKMCATTVEHFKELIHIDNTKHMDLAKPLMNASVPTHENPLTFEIAMSQQIKKRTRPKN